MTMSQGATPGRVPVEMVFVWWRIAASALLLGGIAFAIYRLVAGGFSFAWGGAAVILVIGIVTLLNEARAEACGACHALMQVAIVRLPVEVAAELARSVSDRGSLEPARPNHVPVPGADAYCALIGVYCPSCRKSARVHVSRYGKLGLPGVTEQRAVTWQPLSTEQLLDPPSAEFLSILARGPVR